MAITLEKITRRAGRMLGRFAAVNRGTTMGRLGDLFVDTAFQTLQCPSYDSASNGEQRVLRVMGKHMTHCTAYDVGANIGQWAASAAAYFPQAELHLFEPVQATFYQLERNMREKKLMVRLHNVGLGDASYTATFSLGSDSTTATTCKIEGMPFHQEMYTSHVKCQIERADSFVSANRLPVPTYIKTDCEGMDLRALKGFGNLLQGVRALQFEYGIFNIGSRDLLIDYWNFLTEQGFRVGKIFPRTVQFCDYHFSMENFRAANFIAVRNTDYMLIQALVGKAK